MKINYSKDKIKFEKELNSLDKFTLDFCSVLEKLKINYVIVSGYVSILFGRSRSSEDIDLIIEELDLEKFIVLWNELYKDFECLNTEKIEEAFENYMKTGHSIRFSRKKKFLPNMEVKFPKTELDLVALQNKTLAIVNNEKLSISPIELQISFKLFLRSEKDIEDAKYLYEIFNDKLDIELIKSFNRKLNIEDLFDKYIENGNP